MKTQEKDLLLFYLAFDLITLNISMFFMAWLSLRISLQDYQQMSIYVLHGNLSWIIAYYAFSKKNLYLRDGFFNRFLRITKRLFFFIVVASVINFVLMPKSYSRVFFVEYSVLFYLCEIVAYWLLYAILQNRRGKGINVNKLLIVGVNDTTRFLRKIIDSNPILGYSFIGYACADKDADTDVLGNPRDLAELIQVHNIQMVFVSLSLFLDRKDGKEFLKVCNRLGVRLRFVPKNQKWLRMHKNMESIGSMSLINPQQIPLDDAGLRLSKRGFDLGFSILIILLVFSWLFPIIAILIKLSSKGSVFFVQKRTGINNMPFNCIKFRSMQLNDESDTLQASKADDRITRIGRFLRKTNIDELPQFFNVLVGQMSVVGPRPHMLSHTEQYSQLIAHYLTRHYVKPGITGWAQINGCRGETHELWQMEKRVEYDMEYIENWNFSWDLSIVLRTVFSKSAYSNAG
jgi:putative colanic acid biosysnthesis UDP-glucose lipid carrier transferase